MDFQVIESKEALQGLEEQWRRLCAAQPWPDYYQSWDWYLPFLNHHSQAPDKLRVIMIQQGGELLGIAPMGLDRHGRPLPARRLHFLGKGYSPLLRLLVKPGFEQEVPSELAAYLCRTRRDWDLLDMDCLSLSDASSLAFKDALTDQGVTLHQVLQYDNVVINMPPGFTSEDYYQSRTRKTRAMIREKTNKLNRMGQWVIVRLDGSDPDLELGLQHYADIHRASWRPSGQDLEFQMQLARYLAPRGHLRLFLLYYRPWDGEKGQSAYPSYQASLDTSQTIPEDMEPIAAEFRIIYGDRVWAVVRAYKEKYSKLSPGNVLSWFSLKYFIDQDRYRQMDLQLGEQEYKLRWGELNEQRGRWVGARPGNPLALGDIWFECRAAPYLRRLKRRLFSRGVR
jgi:CelD/BcsL family acetyltransferase involved in cellulose biosynthesis